MNDKHVGRPKKLESLPDNIKRDLHFLIWKGYSSRMIKTILENKWGSKSDIFPITHASIRNYKLSHTDEIKKQVQGNPTIFDQVKKELEGIKDIVQASLEDDGSAFNKLKKLEKLLLERIEFVKEIQDNGFLTPQSEANISSYSKDLLKVFQALREYEKESQETKFEDMLVELIPVFIRNITTVIFRLQKKFYGDNKRYEFINEFEKEIPEVIGVSLKEVTGVDPRDKGEDLGDYVQTNESEKEEDLKSESGDKSNDKKEKNDQSDNESK